ncbi:MAG: DUF1292 domain-containing protein [Peptoniphilaceae bacterium]|nr:DUF1292 domain-containing protein [Peptoniphilaceae bacterium]MDY3738453.1 DUF1292 domain-containing protein [Peptoniphilaceae bacterium]
MDNKIVLINENNEEEEFTIEDTFGIDEKNYAALLSEEKMILIVEIIEKNDEVEFKAIEDQKELDEIIKLYEEIKEE